MRLRRTESLQVPTDPDCTQVRAVVQAYLDGELEPADGEVVRRHLESCRRCGVEADTLQRVIDAVSRQRPDVDVDALERLVDLVDRLPDRPDIDRGGEPDG